MNETNRIGFGFDVHRLVEGRKLILGGVEIPSEKGLLGHSDADVIVHAVCDSILGALALGDIGKHFPDTNEKYRNISSLKLLEHVSQLIAGHQYHVVNLDVMLILERPKIAPYVQLMRNNIAEALQIAVDSVSIKATTSEGLGFTGKGEGAAAQAVVLLERMK
jgi:2-C-methyl-D-erythritol 2,4-cyclodiphosphate synthase